MTQVRAQRPSRTVIGDLALGWRVVIWVSVVAAYAFSWGWVSGPPDRLLNVLNVSPAMAIIVAVFYVTGTCRITLDESRGYVQVSNGLINRRIDVNAILDVSAENGLEFVLASGRRMKAVAYGPSIAGQMSHYPRASRAAERIRSRLGAVQSTARGDSHPEVATTLRTSAIAIGIGLGVLLILVTILLNLLRVG